MSIADSYGYPAAEHINIIVAEHRSRRGIALPISGDHTARAAAYRQECISPVAYD